MSDIDKVLAETWRVEDDTFVTSGKGWICECDFNTYEGQTKERAMANARVIAAAPEALRLLEWIVNVTNPNKPLDATNTVLMVNNKVNALLAALRDAS